MKGTTALRPLPTPERLFTLEEAAARLQIGRSTLKHWVACGKIEHVRLGKQIIRFTQAAIDRFIAARTVAAEDPDSTS